MKMRNYGFADGNGNSINRGVRLWPHEAHDRACQYADDRGVSVDYWDEEAPSDDDGVNTTLQTVEPSK